MTRTLVALLLLFAAPAAATAAAQDEPPGDGLRVDLMATAGGGLLSTPDENERGLGVGQLEARLVHPSGHGAVLRAAYVFVDLFRVVGVADLAYLHRLVLLGDATNPRAPSLAVDASAGLTLSIDGEDSWFYASGQDTRAGLHAALSLDFRAGRFVTGLQVQYRALLPNGGRSAQHVLSGTIGAA